MVLFMLNQTSVSYTHLDVYKRQEQELLTAINGLGIGPQGFGGRTTCLGLAIEQMPTHVAGLPVEMCIRDRP